MALRLPSAARPPVALGPETGRMLRGLAVLFLATGFCGTVTTSLITYVADEFGASRAEQGRALAAIRSDIVISLVMVWIADRVGRRRTVLVTAVLGICGTALCAAAPGLVGFTLLQIVARGFVTATAVVAAVLGVEETPAAARAWASSMLVTCAALGSGTTLVLLPLADLGPRAWRGIYLVPLLLLPLLPATARRLPESRRFLDTADRRRHGDRAPVSRAVVGRFATLALWAGLMALFTAPSRQFLNDFLRDERGFSGAGLTAFGLLTNLPGVIGVVVGGRLADRYGRRPVIGIGLLVFASTSAAMFLQDGAPMWLAATAMAAAGSVVLPAISIYGPELFPTDFRSRASGLLALSGRVGSAIGLTLAGALADRWSLGGVLAVMASALIISALILIFRLPETARRELEEISSGPDGDASGRWAAAP